MNLTARLLGSEQCMCARMQTHTYTGQPNTFQADRKITLPLLALTYTATRWQRYLVNQYSTWDKGVT